MIPSCPLIPGVATPAQWREYVRTLPDEALPVARAACSAERLKNGSYAALWASVAQMCLEEAGHRLPGLLDDLKKTRQAWVNAERRLRGGAK